MPFMEWNKNFELGIEQFDDHHKQLISLLNKAYDSVISRASHADLGAILDQLSAFATYHFSAEEQWMRLHGYVGVTHHHEEHNKFSRRIVEIQNDFCNGRTHLLLEVLTFLKNWLADHILMTDASYGRFAAKLRNV